MSKGKPHAWTDDRPFCHTRLSQSGLRSQNQVLSEPLGRGDCFSHHELENEQSHMLRSDMLFPGGQRAGREASPLSHRDSPVILPHLHTDPWLPAEPLRAAPGPRGPCWSPGRRTGTRGRSRARVIAGFPSLVGAKESQRARGRSVVVASAGLLCPTLRPCLG